MKVKVESCWGGRDVYQRLTLPCGQRLIIRHEHWNRNAAKDALDLIEIETNWTIPRRSIRFDVH
jgi:hypothetical protein